MPIMESALLIRAMSWSCKTGCQGALAPEVCFATFHVMPRRRVQLQTIRTKIFSRFVKVVTKAEAVFTVDEHTSFVVDEFINAEESG